MKSILIVSGSILILLGLSLLILGATLRDDIIPTGVEQVIQPGQWVFILFTSIGVIIALSLLIVWLHHAG